VTQPAITLTVGGTALDLDPDLYWQDEFDWYAIEQSAERGLTGALIIDEGTRLDGRPITLTPPDDNAAWKPRATLTQLQAWEEQSGLIMTLSLRDVLYSVQFRRFDGAPIEARPVIFVADPAAGGFGDAFLTTLRLITVSS
jgi:hypothetical protein